MPPYYSSTSEVCTPLMCVALSAMLPPRQQSLLRSASITGAAAFEEVVARSLVHVWVDTLNDCILADGAICVPCTLPLPADVGTLVVYTNEKVATIAGVALGSITKLRYEGGPAVEEIRGTLRRTDSDFKHILSVVMKGFDSVVSVRDFYLDKHSSLAAINLTPLSNVTCIGDDFLHGCSSLKAIDLNPLKNVYRIGDGFLAGCASLSTVDLLPFSNVVSVGGGFLGRCRSITTIDVCPLRKIPRIWYQFLFDCSSLETISNLSALVNVTEVLDDFLEGCISLTSVDISLFKNVTEIRNGFLVGCNSLNSVDLSPLAKVMSVGNSLLDGCTSLVDVDITPLKKVTRVGDAFMKGASYQLPTDMSQFSPEMATMLAMRKNL